MRVGTQFPIRKQQRAARRAIRPYGGVDYHPPKVVSKPPRIQKPASAGGGPSHSLMPKITVPHFRRPLAAGAYGAATRATPRQLARAGVNPDLLYQTENAQNQARIQFRHTRSVYRQLLEDQQQQNASKLAYRAARPHVVTPQESYDMLKSVGKVVAPTTIKKLAEGKTPTARDVGLDALFFLPWSRAARVGVEIGLAAKEDASAAEAVRAGIKSYKSGKGLGEGALSLAKRGLLPSERQLARSPERQALIRSVNQMFPHHPELAKAQVNTLDQIVKHEASTTGRPIGEVYSKIKVKLHHADMAPDDLKGLYQHVPPPDVPEMPSQLRVKGMPHWIYRLVKAGAQYRDWYKRAAHVLTDAAHRLEITPEQMAGVTAVMSQQANPTFNLRRAVEAIQEWKETGHITPGRYLQGQATKAESILNGTFDWSGLKTNSYFGNFLEHMNPELHEQMFPDSPVTVDRHIAQMFLGKKSLTDKRYEEIRQTLIRAADKLGWTPSEVQAAMWVPWKAQKIAAQVSKRGFTPGPLEQYLPTAADAYERGQSLYRGELYQRPFREHTFSPSIAQVHSEANPDGELYPVLREAYSKLSPHDKHLYDTMTNKAVDGQFERILGLNKIGVHEGPGIWRGVQSAGIASHLEIGPGPLTQETRDRIEALAAAQGIAKHQNSVAWGRPMAEGHGEFQGIHWDPAGKDPVHLSSVMDTVAGEGNVGFVHAPSGGFYVIDFAGGNQDIIERLGGIQQKIGWDGGYVIDGAAKKENDFGESYQDAIDKLPPDVRGRLLTKINQVKSQVDALDEHFLKVPVPKMTDLAGAKALAEKGGHTFHGTTPMRAEQIMAERTLRAGGSNPEAAWTTTNPEMADFYAQGGQGPGPFGRGPGNIVAIPRHSIPGFKEGPFGVHGHQGDIHFQRTGDVVYLADHIHGGYVTKPATYLRFGDLPEGASMNHLSGVNERGVSVYAAWKDPHTGKYVMPSGSEQYLGTQGEIADRPIYEVSGIHSGHSGADGEPLIDTGTARVIRHVHADEVVSEQDSNLTLAGRELHPHETPQWVNQHSHLSDEELRSQLDELNVRYEKMVDELAAGEGKPYKVDTAMRNLSAKKLARKGLPNKTARQELRDIAESKLQKFMDANPGDPRVLQLKEEEARSWALQQEINRRNDLHFQGKGNIKGAFQQDVLGNALIHLTNQADVTTLPHELGHYIETKLTPETRSVIEGWTGPLNTETAHEKFATAIESMIRHGDAPANLKAEWEILQPAFRQVYPKADTLERVPEEVAAEIKKLMNEKDGVVHTLYYLLRNPIVKRSLLAGPGAARSEEEAHRHLSDVAADLRSKGFGITESEIPKVPRGDTTEETGGVLGKHVRDALAGKVDTSDMGVYEATGAKLDSGTSSAAARATRAQDYSAARSERVGRAYGAQEGLSGIDRYIAMSTELKGELPSDAWRNMQGPVADNVNDILNFILDHPGLTLFEKKQASDAIMHGIEMGRAPTESAEKALRKVFGREMSASLKEAFNRKDWGRLILEVASIPRAIMASYDFGAGLRQGIMFGAARPGLFRGIYGKQFKFVMEHNYDALNDAIHSDEYMPIFDKMGIQFTEAGHKGELLPLGQREEYFASTLAERWIPGIRASDRLYTGLLNMARWQYARFMLEMGSAAGYDMADEKILKDMGEFVNAATGRGPLKRLQKAAPVLNATLFSPRLLMSRIAFLNPFWYAQMHPLVRREALRAARNFVTFVGGIGFMAKMAGAQVSLNPTNADFMKVRIGNTRIDPTAGFTQEVRLMAQMISGEVTSSVTGRTEKLSGKAFGVSRMDILQRWLRTKANPVTGIAWDLVKGSNTLGQPITTKDEIGSYFVPLVIQDFMNTFGQHHNIGAGAAAFGLSEAGVGVQTYGTPKKTASEALKKLVSDSKAVGLPDPPKTVQADVGWQNRLDNGVYAGESSIDKAKFAAQLYDERYGTNFSRTLLPHISTEGQAQKLYEDLRSRLAPALARWNTMVNRMQEQAKANEPVPQSAPAPASSHRTAAPAPAPQMEQAAYHVSVHDPSHPLHARLLASHPTAPSGASSYIAAAAQQRGLDPEAVLAVASQEGLGGGVGDSGSSFGPFQLHAGGALPAEVWAKGAQYAAAWAWSPAGIHYALDQIASVARGLHGQAAVDAIVRRFERPASPGQEVAGAMASYGNAPSAGHGIGGGGFGPQGSSAGLSIPGSPAADTSTLAVDQQGLLDLASGHYDPSVQILHLFRAASSQPIKRSVTVGGRTFHFQLPPGGGGKTARGAIALAQHFLGTPYVFGGESPGGFDCSGLLQYIFAQQGVHIPRTSEEQWRTGMAVGKGQLRPGDAVFFRGAAGEPPPGHVGIYIGHGMFIEAPHTGATVRVSRLRGYPGYMGARRFVGKGRRA